MMCKEKHGITADEEILTESEENGGGNPFGSGADADARQRAAMGALSQTSDPTSAPLNASVPTPTSCKDIPTDATDSFKLGKRFTVGSFSSGAALPHTIPSVTAKGLSRQNVICNLRRLVVNCIDPLFDHYLPLNYRITISSGFRNQTNGSDHNVGSAADLIFYKDGVRQTGRDLAVICKDINETLKLPFTQMIHEADKLLHIACHNGGNSGVRLFWSTGFGSPVSGVGYRYSV